MSNDWLPRKRVELLHMAKTWISVLNSPADNQGGGLGPPETWAVRWRVPAEALATLESLTALAEPLLLEAAAAKYRNDVINARIRMVFGGLAAHMRYLYNHFFLEPELKPDNFAMMLLNGKNHTLTPTGTPQGQVTLEFFLLGRHQLGYRIVFLLGNPKDRANKSFRLNTLITNPGEPYPTSPEQLTKSFSTKRLRDVINFNYEDSGKIFHCAVQIENGGKKGPWGPIVSALIP